MGPTHEMDATMGSLDPGIGGKTSLILNRF
jgi:hypothetical protein